MLITTDVIIDADLGAERALVSARSSRSPLASASLHAAASSASVLSPGRRPTARPGPPGGSGRCSPSPARLPPVRTRASTYRPPEPSPTPRSVRTLAPDGCRDVRSPTQEAWLPGRVHAIARPSDAAPARSG